MGHIISIEQFINEIIERSHIKGTNKNFNIMSDDLTLAQRLHSDIVWWSYECSILNTKKNYFGIPKSQGVHALDFNDMMNTKKVPPVHVLFDQGSRITV